MTRQRVLGLGMAAMALLAVVVVALAWPRTEAERLLESIEVDETAAVAVLVVEAVEPNRGTVTLSVEVGAGGLDLPPSGATLVSNVPGLGPLRVPPATELPAGATTEALIDGAALRGYPFDRYPLDVSLVVVAGSEQEVLAGDALPPALPLDVVAVSTAAGFEASADATTSGHRVDLALALERPGPTVVWAVAMMALYWLLATSAFGVSLAVLLGLRPLETRYFAWLTAMLFAFAAFRGTAPGSPPIGVFLDLGAFFWAVGIVVVSQLLLLAYFLTGDRRTA